MEMDSDEFFLRCWRYKPGTLRSMQRRDSRRIISTEMKESIQIMLIPNAMQDVFFCFGVSKESLVDPF